MKTSCWNLCVVLFALASGCASFRDQTTEAEPHAVLRFVGANDLPGNSLTIESVDGHRVSIWFHKERRVRPGLHQVVFRDVETVIEESGPLQVSVHLFGSGRMESEEPVRIAFSETEPPRVSNVNPFSSTQPVEFSCESRRITFITNSIVAEVGWLYELDGLEVRRFPLRHEELGNGATAQ